ncbi:uncharacterized protein LOC134216253 [Armigeres subalbatus]|uniref:uncharacterized protein LOC134216253 n=1 Tax=Armigeres subalbatus TaxID=124917 RepID=UPI002ED48A0F
MPSDGDGFQRLESAKFSIRSPRTRAVKCVQQELIRASERKHRPRNDTNRYAMGETMFSGMGNSLEQRRKEVLEAARKYFPQCDEIVLHAVVLYSESKVQNLSEIKQKDKIMQSIGQQFIQEPVSIRKKYIKAAILPNSKRFAVCSDPFKIMLDLHWKQSTAGIRAQDDNATLGTNIDIGPFAHNIDRAESGEECDPTRLRMITWTNCIHEARNLWKRMTPEQKLPFFMQAYMASHFPATMDQAL